MRDSVCGKLVTMQDRQGEEWQVLNRVIMCFNNKHNSRYW